MSSSKIVVENIDPSHPHIEKVSDPSLDSPVSTLPLSQNIEERKLW